MSTKIKKNLWWIISSIVLFIPIALAIHGLLHEYTLSEKLSLEAFSFIVLFLILAITGIFANKIKKVVLKVLWIILGLLIYLIGWILIFNGILISYSASIEDYFA